AIVLSDSQRIAVGSVICESSVRQERSTCCPRLTHSTQQRIVKSVGSIDTRNTQRGFADHPKRGRVGQSQRFGLPSGIACQKRVDDVFVLVGVRRAGHVQEASPRSHSARRLSKYGGLHAREPPWIRFAF